eukprot:465054_1
MSAILVAVLAFICSVQSGSITMHINNCLEEMTFMHCIDFIGTWIQHPTPKIATYDRGIWIVDLPTNAKAQQGNCSYYYRNSHGNWTAFFDWTWAYLGDHGFGGGTDDEIDGECTDLNTDLGRPDDPHLCLWFYYEGEGLMDCTYRTNDTLCKKPYDMQEQHSSVKHFKYVV